MSRLSVSSARGESGTRPVVGGTSTSRADSRIIAIRACRARSTCSAASRPAASASPSIDCLDDAECSAMAAEARPGTLNVVAESNNGIVYLPNHLKENTVVGRLAERHMKAHVQVRQVRLLEAIRRDLDSLAEPDHPRPVRQRRVLHGKPGCKLIQRTPHREHRENSLLGNRPYDQP